MKVDTTVCRKDAAAEPASMDSRHVVAAFEHIPARLRKRICDGREQARSHVLRRYHMATTV